MTGGFSKPEAWPELLCYYKRNSSKARAQTVLGLPDAVIGWHRRKFGSPFTKWFGEENKNAVPVADLSENRVVK